MKPRTSYLSPPDVQGRAPHTQIDKLEGLALSQAIMRWVYRVPPHRAIDAEGNYIPLMVAECISRHVVKEIDYIDSLLTPNDDTVDRLVVVLQFGERTYYHRYKAPDPPPPVDGTPWVWRQRFGQPWQPLIEKAVADFEWWEDETVDFTSITALEWLTQVMNARGFDCRLQQIPRMEGMGVCVVERYAPHRQQQQPPESHAGSGARRRQSRVPMGHKMGTFRGANPTTAIQSRICRWIRSSSGVRRPNEARPAMTAGA